MPVEEQLATIFEVLEGGVETTAEVIPFPVDAGATALEGTTTTVQLGNGIATEVSQLTVTEAGTTTTAGVGLLAMDVGAVGLAIAPALGILAGVGLYSLAPEFWTNVSNTLLEAGQTVGGKVRAYINSNTREIGLSAETIEIFKDAFNNAGLFNTTTDTDLEINTGNYNISDLQPLTLNNSLKYLGNATSVIGELNGLNTSGILDHFISEYKNSIAYNSNVISGVVRVCYQQASGNYPHRLVLTIHSIIDTSTLQYGINTFLYGNVSTFQLTVRYDINKNFYDFINSAISGFGNYNMISDTTYPNISSIFINGLLTVTQSFYNDTNQWFDTGLTKIIIPEWLQPDATYPTISPFPQTYPTWNPWSVPVEGFPDVYPVEIPELNPDANQDEAQNPSALPDDNPDLLPWFINNFPQPEPNPNPYPEPSIEPDPDPQPEPDPIENPTEPDTDPNPVDPNPDPSLPALPIVPDLPDTVPANAMFTVYKPTIAQVNAFGGWLWSSNIMEAIKRIWQNPLDGIISFMKVYVDAPTSGSDTIKVGMLDSEVSSAVVTGQFVTVECGSINIKEKFYNATDYSPFVSLHVYLPFIGIVELDIDEFMNGEIKITYHVDVYTGTCLAEIKARRSYDKPEWTIIYTFSGNASQQLPLTSASFSGALSSLVSIVGGGLAIASGGGLGLLAGATGMAHAVTHEMVHLAHSGSLSANAGIMGARKPFLILTRRRSYDANGYNELYGYPSNKTVFLNNCSGFVRVKDIQLKTSATDSENKEIESLLKNGVII